MPKEKLKVITQKINQSIDKAFPSIVAIFIGLLFGLIVMLITNPARSIFGFGHLFIGGFDRGLVELLYQATPIILTGLSVGFAFRTGLFNIGASGQVMVGATVAILVGTRFTFLPGITHMLVAVLFAALAGALWGLVPGVLKAYRNVNEVVASIMMNYIGLYTSLFFVRKFALDFVNYKSKPVASSAVIPRQLNLFGLQINFYTGIFIALIAVFIIHILLTKTTKGYELQAVGFNRDASKYAGINEKRNIIYAMVIAGLLAGIAGATIYLVPASGRRYELVEAIASEGFDGISVALIGQSNPIGIFFAGLFMAYIRLSGWGLQLYGYKREIVDIIIGTIIYTSALTVLMRGLIQRYRKYLAFEKRGVKHE